MKLQNIIPSILILLSANVTADVISIGTIDNIHVADIFSGSSSSGAACETNQNAANCNFLQTFTSNYLNDDLLGSIVTNSPLSSVKSPTNGNAYIDLGFSENLYNGIGDDIVLFFIGNGTSFGLDIFTRNDDVTAIHQATYSITSSDVVRNADNSWLCVNSTDSECVGGFPLSAIFIDLGNEVAGDQAIGRLRITFGQGFNGGTSSNFSLAGGLHDSIVVVPLPLPALLFGSGIALLGWIGRKKAT